MTEMNYLNDGPSTQAKEGFIERIRDFVKKQKRTHGYELATAVGSNTFNLEISGSARVLLGFTMMGETPDDYIQASSMKLTINNEIIIDSVNPNFFGPAFTEEAYYFFPRPLNGSDKVVLEMVGTVGPTTNYMVIYYI